MKKIGLLCLGLVMALGGLGICYAAWTDTITIDGTVTTGTVDIVVVDWSNTWVYKVPGAPNDIVIMHQWESDPDNSIPPLGALPVGPSPFEYHLAYADSDYAGDDAVTILYHNLFPSIDFVADILLHYEGTIPAKISLADIIITGDTEMVALWAGGKLKDGTGAWISWYWSDADGNKLTPILDPVGIQLHNCDYILVEGHIHLPQDSALMNKFGSFTATLEVKQWNEVP